MRLFNKTIDRQLFKQYSLGSDLSKQEVVAKIFNPYGAGTWFILNSDPEDPEYLWAIVDLGYGAEVGSVGRSELENYRNRMGWGFERDLSFDPVNALELYNGLHQGKFYAKGGGVGSSEENTFDKIFLHYGFTKKRGAYGIRPYEHKKLGTYAQIDDKTRSIEIETPDDEYKGGYSVKGVIDFLKSKGFEETGSYADGGEIEVVYERSVGSKKPIKLLLLNKGKEQKGYTFSGKDQVAVLDNYNRNKQEDLEKLWNLKGYETKYADGGNIEDFSDNQRMVMNQNVALEHHHEELEDILKDEMPVPAWVVAKMATATDSVSDITHYLDGQKELMEDEMEDENEEEDEEQEEIENKIIVEPIDVSAGTKAELTKKFTDDAMGNLKGFLKGMEGIDLRDDYTFDYKDEQYEVEPIINSDENGVSNAVFTIFDGDGEEVGDVSYSREGGKQKFTANSEFFSWNNAKFEDGGYFDGTIPKVSTYMSTYAKGGSMNKHFWSWRYAPNDDSYKSVVIYKTDVDNENSYDSVKQIKDQLTKEGVTKFIEEESKHFWSWKYAPNDNTYKSVIIYKTDIDDENSYDSVEQIKEQLVKEGVNKFIEEEKENYAKGGEVAKAEILGLKRNFMGTTDVEMKISGMRKPQSFIVYPISKDDSKEIITIQSETRIGKIDLSTGRGLMSQSHSNGAYFVHFQMDKLIPFTISESDLEDLKMQIFKTAGDNVGSRGIVSDNSGASGVYAKGGGVGDNVLRLEKGDIFEVIDTEHTVTGQKFMFLDYEDKYGTIALKAIPYPPMLFKKLNDKDKIVYITDISSDGIKKLSDDKSGEMLVRRYKKYIQYNMEQGGETEEGVDLFEDYENIPPKLQDVLDKYEYAFQDGDYRDLEKALKEVNKLGYTFEYYLDGQAYDLRKIGEKGKSEVEEYAKGGSVKKDWWQTVVNPNEDFNNYDDKKPIDWEVDDFKSWVVSNSDLDGNVDKEVLDVVKMPKSKLTVEYLNKNGSGKNKNEYYKEFGNWQSALYDIFTQMKKDYLFKKSRKYILKADIKTVTVNRKGKEITYNSSDVLNGAYVLAKGGDITSKANYVGKNDVVEVELKDGSKVKPANGYWIKKGAEPVGAEPTPTASGKSENKVGETEIRKDMRGNWRAETTVDNFNGYDWRISTVKTYSGNLVSSAQGGKTEPTGSKGIKMFIYTMYQDPNYTLEVSSPKRLTEKVVSEQHVKGLAKFKKFMETGTFGRGGKISNFDKLSAKVAKQYEGKPVKSQYQEEYGKYYSKEEAQEVGDKVAGKVKAMQSDKKAFGGLFSGAKSLVSSKKYPQLEGKQVMLKSGKMVNVFEQSGDTLSVLELGKFDSGERPYSVNISEVDMTSFKLGGATKSGRSGSELLKQANILAKKIRKDGESWNDAKKRAFAQLKK